MAALVARYHAKCLIALYNKENQQRYGKDYNNNEKHLNGIVLAELASFMEQSTNTVDGVFKLTELGKMYRNRLIELGGQAAERIHTTRLKSRLLSHFEGLTEFTQGKITFLAFDMEVGNALIKIYENDYDDEAFILSRAATILRKDIFDKNYKAFERSFSTECRDTPPPPSFKLFINMLLQGPSIDSRKKTLRATYVNYFATYRA